MAKPPGRLTDADLLDRISRLPHARASFKQLVRETGAKGRLRDDLEAALLRLSNKGTLVELRSGQYVLTRQSREYAVGRLNVHRDGYAFLQSDHPIEGVRGDVFLPPEEAAGAMHGDRVVIRIARIEPNGRADGEIYEVLKRAHATVVGEFRVTRHGNVVVPHDERVQQWIDIPDGMELPEAHENPDRIGVTPVEIKSPEDLHGLIVNAEVLEFPEGNRHGVGRVIEILGDPNDFGVDVEITIRKHHLPHHFPPEVIQQAKAIPPEVPEEEIARRQDFRSFEIVTIDGETARDFDDAVWVDRLPNGNYALHVHIADVSYYVRPGSPIDLEAQNRGTSVYFPDRAVPMLPLELSTEICSLKPQVDRLVLSALLEIDGRGDTVRQEFARGVIRSAERMTYTSVHLMLEGEGEPAAAARERYAPLVPRFQLMKELALLLLRRREKRGSIDFDLPEPLIEFGAEGEMVGVIRHPRTIAHRIIEEFMLAANEAVASHLEALEIPSVYRIHEPPSAQRVLDFQEAAQQFGYTLELSNVPVKKFANLQRTRSGQKIRRDVVVTGEDFQVSSRVYQKLIAKIEGKPEERILSYLLLRSLKQARYSAENQGHFALAAPTYTHFTSPIRRYPDLIVHRLLSRWLDGDAPDLSQDELQSVADDCSFTERRAAEAERELVEWKKTRFMIDRVGDEFDAIITSTTRFGFFVELHELYVEGLVPIDTLPGERFTYQENSRRIVGDRSQRQFRLGDPVRVRLDRVDEVEKKLQFSLVEPERPRRKRQS